MRQSRPEGGGGRTGHRWVEPVLLLVAAVALVVAVALEPEGAYARASVAILGAGSLLFLAWGRHRSQSRPSASPAQECVAPDIDDLPAPLLHVGPEGLIQHANTAAHRLMGRVDGTLTGFRLGDLMSETEADGPTLGWTAGTGTGTVTTTGTGTARRSAESWTHLHPDGTERRLEVLSTEPGDGRQPRWLSLQDVTDRDAAAAEVLALRMQVQQSQRLQAMGTAAGGIAHDFNNLLAPILGYSEMAQLDLDEADPLREDLEQVRTAARRAQRLVAQMMQFSRPHDGTLAPVHLHEVALEAASLLRASIPSTIEIHTLVDRRTPPVLGGATRLHQVLMNLCTNAAHAMPDGGVIELTLDTHTLLATHTDQPVDGERRVRLRVADDGVGMDRDTLEKIFDPFFTTRAPDKGTGLGLSSVRGIVGDMGGTISVESEPGAGTVFTLLFPPFADLEQNEHPGDEVVRAMRGGGRIIVVDDEESILRVTRRSLARFGFEVETYLSPAQALTAVLEDPDGVDLLWTDHYMPDLTGLQLSERIRELRTDLPIVLTSGDRDAVTPSDVKRLEPCEFLPKPVEPLVMAEVAVRRIGAR